MSDDSPPKIQQDAQNDSPENRPAGQEEEHRREAKSYAFIVGWICADVLVVFGHIYSAVWVFYFVLVVALSLFTYHAVKGWPIMKRILSGVYAGLCVALPICLYWISRPTTPETPPKPHLELGFSIAGSKGFPLMLTNNAFEFPVNGRGIGFNLHDFKAIVMVPIPLGTTNVSVRFALINGSERYAEDGTVKISLPTNSPVRFEHEWFESTIEDLPWTFEWNMPKLIPHGLLSSPIIDFDTRTAGMIPVSVMAFAPQMQGMMWGMELHFMEMDSPGKPFVEIATVTTNKNGTFTLHLSKQTFEWRTNALGRPAFWQEGKGP